MRTPVWDFVRAYAASKTERLHMPGHKGVGELEKYDITEVKGADSLYEADGIIAESEAYASELFGARTFYSTEGSSLAIRAMLFLARLSASAEGKKPIVLAGRNAHRVFISAAALLDLEVAWLPSGGSYMSSAPSAAELCSIIDGMSEKPCAVYLTSPDYLGATADIRAISEVCRERGIFLLVDNAHGAYLKFLSPSRHPMDLGADMCADSAHKTLPTLTGGAYLHISKSLPTELADRAKQALALFGSTSPSYLILASLDKTNAYLASDFSKDLTTIIDKTAHIKRRLIGKGYTLYGDEELKITVDAAKYGYTGYELADALRMAGGECEMADPDYLVVMLSPMSKRPDILLDALLPLKRREQLQGRPEYIPSAERVLSVREAMLSPSVTLPARECVGRILATPDAACPPAVPIIMPGERISKEHIPALLYYGKDTLSVVRE